MADIPTVKQVGIENLNDVLKFSCEIMKTAIEASGMNIIQIAQAGMTLIPDAVKAIPEIAKILPELADLDNNEKEQLMLTVTQTFGLSVNHEMAYEITEKVIEDALNLVQTFNLVMKAKTQIATPGA